MLKLLSDFKFYSLRKVNTLIKNLFAKIREKLNFSVEDVWFVPAGYTPKSGSVITYFLRVQNFYLNIKLNLTMKHKKNALKC